MPEKVAPDGNGAPVPPGITGPGAVGKGATPVVEAKGPWPEEPEPEPEPLPLPPGTAVAPPAITVTVT